MDDSVESAAVPDLLHRRAIGGVGAHELEAAERPQPLEARFLELHIVVRVEVVEPDDGIAALEEAFGDVVSDEAGRAGDQYLHAR